MVTKEIYGIQQRLDYWKRRIANDADVPKGSRRNALDFLDYCIVSGFSKPR